MDNKTIFSGTLLNAPPALIKTQYTLIAALTKELASGEEVDADTFALLVEDNIQGRLLSVRHARELILSSGAFTFEGRLWHYNENFAYDDDLVTFEEFQNLLFEKKEKKAVSGSDLEKDAIIKGLHWCVHMVDLAEESGMDGLPAFLRCGDEDSLIGKNVAGTATPDALSLLCKGISYLKEAQIDTDKLSHAFSFLVKMTLKCQAAYEGWDKGGFLPLEDQPEAEHPTVDATCLSIMALCDFYEGRKTLEENGLKIAVQNSVIEQAVLDGLEFLFRMQQPEGSFGIYRYEDEYPDGSNLDRECASGFAQPNENCTRITLSTMGVCKGSGIFDATEQFEYYGKCSSVIKRAYTYLISHTASTPQGKVWTPYFGDTASNYSAADVLVSSGRVCRCFIPVWWQMEEVRSQIQEYNSVFMDYWVEAEKKGVGPVGRYSFKTPRKNSYSVAMYTWQSYPKMIAGFAVLQAYNIFGVALTKEEWELIDKAVSDTLDLQHSHGHWNLPNTSQPFCAATLAAIELLIEYRNAKGRI